MDDVLTQLEPIPVRPTDRIPTFPIWPFDDCLDVSPYNCDDELGTCDGSAVLGTLATWCASSGAYTRRDHLLLWLPGQGNYPFETQFIPQTAACAGFRTINLAWDNPKPAFGEAGNLERWCRETDGGSPELLGGDCSSGCLLATAQEMITGVDDPSTAYPAHPMHGIEGRLKLALEHLHVLDLNEDATNDHHWDDFCDEDHIQWHDIEVAGYSEGAQLAMFISLLAPGNANQGGNSIGLFTADGGAPLCGFEVDFIDPPDTGLSYYPEELDDPGFDPCGLPAGCPPNNRFMFIHDDGEIDQNPNGLIAAFFPWIDTALDRIGIKRAAPVYLDADVQAGTFHIDDTADTGIENFFRTDQEPSGAPGQHGSMGDDAEMVRFRDAVPFIGVVPAPDAANYFLQPAYLQAFCELDQ